MEAEAGDLVEVSYKGRTYRGILMPSSSQYTVIKLDNGYNIGIGADSVKLLKKAEKRGEVEREEESAEGKVAILGCGGTIASKVDYRTGAVYPSITPSELRAIFPELARWPIASKQVLSVFSEDMGVEEWFKICENVESALKEGAKGVVILHGTDTLSYTAAFLSYALPSLPAPVVLVGAQRSSDRPSSDNRLNLMNAVFSATQDFGEVAACMHASTNDDFCYLHRGTRVRKMHTSRRDAFKSVSALPLAKVDYRNQSFEAFSSLKNRAPLRAEKHFNANVCMVYAHPNLSPKLVEKLRDFDGVLFVGTGLGHLPLGFFGGKGVYKEVKELVESGVLVAIASQCLAGRLSHNVYSNGRLLKELGVVGDGLDWTPEAAYVKLGWVLGKEKDVKKAKTLLERNVAGEISRRSWVGDGYQGRY